MRVLACSAAVKPTPPAGEWRGLEVAIKTVVFQSDERDNQLAAISSEAAIASNLAHANIVATYSHDIHGVPTASDCGNELGIYKFYLVRPVPACHTSHRAGPVLRETRPMSARLSVYERPPSSSCHHA